jgi:CHAT domain-containing protein
LLADAGTERPGVRLGALSAPEILALAPADGGLVAPVFTSQGCAIFIVPHGTRSISARHVLMLDDFTTTDLSALVTGISAGTAEAIHSACEVLWERLVGRIAERLLKLTVRRIMLLPQGGLGLLPVHAACRAVDGECRHLADDIEVAYAPSAYALDTARKKDPRDRKRTAVVVGVTRSAHFGDLPSVEYEVRRVARVLGTNPLLDAQATVGKILVLAKDAEYLHLACHGNFGWGADPLESALYLADDQALSLADVISRLDLTATRLVALSACESGVTDTREAPDEFFGLTAGFMQAGATGVLSSLWKVDDLSTGLLVADFYRRHLNDALRPAAALAAAQHWLRGLTREDISRHLKEAGRTEERRELLLVRRRDEKPFAHSYYWAPFTFSGA